MVKKGRARRRDVCRPHPGKFLGAALAPRLDDADFVHAAGDRDGVLLLIPLLTTGVLPVGRLSNPNSMGSATAACPKANAETTSDRRGEQSS